MIIWMSRSPGATKRMAGRILKRVLKTKAGPAVLALSGKLGSGKTTFIQGLAASLGIREKVQSPTFVLMKWYKLPRRAGLPRHLVHIDAYRLESLAEAKHLGLREAFRDRDAIVVVEWADRIMKLIPHDAVWIQFKHGKRTRERIITLKHVS